MSSSKVNQANKASPEALASHVQPTLTLKGQIFYIDVQTSSTLSESARKDIWNIFETNMRDMYTLSSFGWNPPEKQAELFHPLSRFIVATRNHRMEDEENERIRVDAYATFRFEREGRDNVVYCYELQVSPTARQLGLGKALMQDLSRIGAAWGMKRVMLTVFKANVDARRFYEHMGFTMDETSPGFAEEEDEWMDEEEGDYVILSKPTSV